MIAFQRIHAVDQRGSELSQLLRNYEPNLKLLAFVHTPLLKYERVGV